MGLSPAPPGCGPERLSQAGSFFSAQFAVDLALQEVKSVLMTRKDQVSSMEILKSINAGLAFLLELAMLAAFGYWGFQGEKSIWIKWGLGIGIPLVAVILWGLLLAPRANRRLNSHWGPLLSLGLFCLAAFALYQTNHPGLAIALAVIAIVNRILIILWRQW